MKKLNVRDVRYQEGGSNIMVIPERFQRRIDAHMLGNMLDIDNYPLILAIIGKTGNGEDISTETLPGNCWC